MEGSGDGDRRRPTTLSLSNQTQKAVEELYNENPFDSSLMSALMAGTALADTTLKLVEVITSPERTETLKSIVSKFETENPGTKVEIISLPWAKPSRNSPPWSRPAKF